jgi:hypothetical protein
MTYDALQALKWAVPFRPFRLFTADGRWLDIRHPNHLWPGQQKTLVGVPMDPSHPEACATWVSLDTVGIERVEFPDAAGERGS